MITIEEVREAKNEISKIVDGDTRIVFVAIGKNKGEFCVVLGGSFQLPIDQTIIKAAGKVSVITVNASHPILQ